ncbi:helix-turn-helix domain-containing protein, partial [Xanthomonas vasicola]|uniref:helix-turn-helix domain-containing protein n=1 Tax=Xanthomonas vasicola TaxID=56459 RepID=UPI001FED7FB8
MITNSVVPMPKAPMVNASNAGGKRDERMDVRLDMGMDQGRLRTACAWQLFAKTPAILIHLQSIIENRVDRLGDIALFLRVLDLGSITAGARSLDLSVAVASQRLKRLERE